MFSAPPLPAGMPLSLWFFIVTLIIYALQRFPLTGIFLMIVAAPFWSTILINLGMAGIAIEVLAGKVKVVWLILPALYLGGYYTLYALERRAAGALIVETGAHNAAQRLAFSPGAQDLLVANDGNSGLEGSPFLRRYGLDRVFDDNGRVSLLADVEARSLVARNKLFESARIYVTPGPYRRGVGEAEVAQISMPGQPARPVVEVRPSHREEKRGTLPVKLVETRITDMTARRSVVVRSGMFGLLKPYPMWAMGCGLNSGAAKWECFHGFMRDRIGLAPGTRPFQGPADIVAAALGLQEDEDVAARAVGADFLRPMAEEVERETADRELAIVEQILANPEGQVKDAWLWHLPNRPDATLPLVSRMVEALGRLPDKQRLGSENARQLWRLLATQPDPVLSPHRALLVSWLGGDRRDPGYDSARDFLPRLDAAVREEREILLDRLEVKRGDLPIDLLPSFCRMGPAAPDEVKQRLLALWHKRGEPREGYPERRDSGDAMLYLVLARMGLKQQAGRVEQRYYGGTFAGIWDEIDADTPVDRCPLTDQELRSMFRNR